MDVTDRTAVTFTVWFGTFTPPVSLHLDRQADRQTGRQADRQTDRQTGRQADRQTDRQMRN